MKENYQKKLDGLLQTLEGRTTTSKLLLHSCCAPCSSYVLEYLSRYFEITVLYYNPNIYPESEFRYRAQEQERLIQEMKLPNPVHFLSCPEEERVFYDAVRGLEHTGEGGKRCYECFRLRLEKTAELAKEKGFDFFTTTLSISPLKNAVWLNEIGETLSIAFGVPYLYADFKKKEGYKRSIELSARYGLYRQDYCGCVFSQQERKKEKKSP